MIRAEVKGYIKEQVNSECNNLNKLNKLIEIYLCGYVEGYKFDNVYSLDDDKLNSMDQDEANEIKRDFEKRKATLKEFREQTVEIIENNIDVYQADLVHVISFYKNLIVLEDDCFDVNLRIEAIQKLEEKFNLR